MKTYNQKSPFDEMPETELIVNFMQYQFNPSQGLNVKLSFIDAQILHDTELLSKMDPYVKIKINDVEKWRSKTVKKGDKFPNFQGESVNVNFKNMGDVLAV